MNTELILKELESAYGRKKNALGKGMTKQEMKDALRDGAYRVFFPADDEDAAWYELIRFNREEQINLNLEKLDYEYLHLRVEAMISGITPAVRDFLLPPLDVNSPRYLAAEAEISSRLFDEGMKSARNPGDGQ